MLLALFASKASGVDVGFEKLFEDHNETVSSCFDVDLPTYMAGTFILPSLGQFGMGDRQFVGSLDPYGKFNRFTMSNNGKSLCLESRMMDTNFWANSRKLGTIGPQVLFSETSPPRNYSGTQDLTADSDNTFVNTYSMGDVWRAVTDSPVELQFNLTSLEIMGNVTWDDDLKKKVGFPSGSAHPIHNVTTGCVYNFHGVTGPKHEIFLYELCPDAPNTRKVLSSFTSTYIPYCHSWGMSKNYAIFTFQHFYIDYQKMLKYGTLDQAFVPVDVDKPQRIVVLPVYGGREVVFELDEPIYYTHTLNTFEMNNSIVMDMIRFPSNPFETIGNLEQWRNKTWRDAQPLLVRGTVTRLTLDLKSKKVSLTPISNPVQVTDFPSFHRAYRGLPYCYFFAVEWFHDGAAYGSMSIVKHNVCDRSSGPFYYYVEDAYPSEATFIDDPSNQFEDGGVLVFTLLDGHTGRSRFVVLDARTMKEISVTQLNSTIGFTTHGQFYPSVSV